MVIQDLWFCSQRLDKCWTKDSEHVRVNIERVKCLITAGASQPNSQFWSFFIKDQNCIVVIFEYTNMTDVAVFDMKPVMCWTKSTLF